MTRHFDDVQLGSIELFCLAAETGSFTAAANLAGVTPAAVSRSVARLEERLGVRLFVRTTRQMRLTDSGRLYYQQCRQALTQLVDAEREVTGQQSQPSGLLRISVPTPYAHYRLLPKLPAFRRQFPDVQVDVHISNRNIDFADDGFDLAIRGKAPTDSGLIARTLEEAELVVVATLITYAKRARPPRWKHWPNMTAFSTSSPAVGAICRGRFSETVSGLSWKPQVTAPAWMITWAP